MYRRWFAEILSSTCTAETQLRYSRDAAETCSSTCTAEIQPRFSRDLVFDLLRDLRLQPGELELLLEEQEGLLDPRRHVERREDLLQLLRVRRGQRGAKVGQLACLVDLGPIYTHIDLLED